jgi:hypothetical protein
MTQSNRNAAPAVIVLLAAVSRVESLLTEKGFSMSAHLLEAATY